VHRGRRRPWPRAAPTPTISTGWLALGWATATARPATRSTPSSSPRARPSDGERVVEVLLGKPRARRGAHRQGRAPARGRPGLRGAGSGDLKHAFEALTGAIHLDPGNDALVADAERLAAATGSLGRPGERGLGADHRGVGARRWRRGGGPASACGTGCKLDRADYALPSLRRALELDAANLEPRTTRWPSTCAASRSGPTWPTRCAPRSPYEDRRRREARRVPPARRSAREPARADRASAVEAYEAAAALGDGSTPGLDDALAALERLYRKDEKWANLAKVLERRAEALDHIGEGGRATAVRRELATLRAREARRSRGCDHPLRGRPREGRRRSRGVEGPGRSLRQDRPLRRLPAHPRAAGQGRPRRREACRPCARSRPSSRTRTAPPIARSPRTQSILDLDANADDAYRGLGPHAAGPGASWYDLTALLDRHVAAAKNPVQRVELYLSRPRRSTRRSSTIRTARSRRT
jgi:tetratricopeptide (TPR) repeat protein